MKELLGDRWAYLLMLLIMAGCYPAEDFTVQELDSVITLYEPEEDYGRYTTFSVPDSVGRVGLDDDSEGQFDDLILELVRTNMTELGYVEETDPENNQPDLVVLVDMVLVDNTVIAPCYPLYPGWGWWYWPPGWGPGWCGGLPGIPVGQYTTGTIILNMLHPEEANTLEETVPVVWNAYLNGLVTGSDASLEARIRTNINQAFDQSTYLGR